ncbi:AAA domain-containing protein [Lysinibacillus irui]|uniref:AAA domain-containing protein n=1 Tax=Lysinibacillus irui TaxID=2998077 RepID=A0ABU5NGM4_9BACI|nr:AAA domain-containing protein [Lysinibacillus irui]MEA0553865.1 AAA domain-containing protein [Lysinibacillus irui]MEA0975193.1 AAA domain-containing protein [Lysinibacillus irui]MEA1041347.1 AAA domain-containing protein [Lysinibacillus irui]
MQDIALLEKQRCNLILTNKAKEAVEECSANEHAFFALQRSFTVYIEKRKAKTVGETFLSIYFNAQDNEKLHDYLAEKTVIMDCVLKVEGLLATNIRFVHMRGPINTNRRLAAALQFVTKPNNGAGIPLELHTKIRQLPIAEERTEYVKKRIASWEGYLKIQERDATIDDIHSEFKQSYFNEDFTRLTIVCPYIKNKEWKQLEGLSVSIQGVRGEIGQVLKANAGKQTAEIDLKPFVQDLARKDQLNLRSKQVSFSNFATLSQIRRLRNGFTKLEKGEAVNPNLETILFERRPTVRASKLREDIEFHNNLNEYQRRAVLGALSVEDLYVIQGPPGTGKTTVISEICQQNVKAGLKTLVASQSNLAVDNALGRLLSNQEIRILRYGRTESIEEEGKKFIEENVALQWREQTLAAIEEAILVFPEREQELKANVEKAQNELAKLEQWLEQLRQEIAAKEQAAIDEPILQQEIQALKKELKAAKADQQSSEAQKDHYEKQLAQIEPIVQQLEQTLADYPSVEQLQRTIQETTRKVEQLEAAAQYKELQEQKQQLTQQFQEIQHKYEIESNRLVIMKEAQKYIHTLTSFELIERFLQHYQIRPSHVLSHQMNRLQHLEDAKDLEAWSTINARLQKAIAKLEALVTHEVKERAFAKSRLQPVQSFSLQNLTGVFAQLNTAFQDGQAPANDMIESYLLGLYMRRDYVWQKGVALKQQQEHKDQEYDSFRKNLMTLIHQECAITSFDVQSYQRQLQPFLQHTERLQQLANTFQIAEEPEESVEYLKILSAQSREALQQASKQLETVEQAKVQLVPKQASLKTVTTSLHDIEQQLAQMEERIKDINIAGLKKEKQLATYTKLLQSTPERTAEEVMEAIQTSKQAIETLHRQEKQLPLRKKLQEQWREKLQNATEYDLDEIRKLYVRHANVIGTTCVASASKEFMENYPTFDVVVIDEVSKATPPELLLPMLKGKKVILVGDHHQLPPLLGDDTLEETLKAMLEENPNFEGAQELKNLLRESLFERLFNNLPPTHKQMLALQYRMHEKIMQSITPFYAKEENGLQCGLPDSDAARDHGLEGQFVKRHDHLLWIDIPTEKPYLEEQVKGGTSRYNEGELQTIRHILLDLNDAVKVAKEAGRIPQDAKKSVGVISFYGEQVKRINRLLQQELQLPHLQFRTGTVDKFQGMEMDVILVSMVRNTPKGGDIGFAKDYRRLNVALSRARELLLLIGSAEMFAKRAKHQDTREMYTNLLNTVKSYNGLRNHEGLVM